MVCCCFGNSALVMNPPCRPLHSSTGPASTRFRLFSPAGHLPHRRGRLPSSLATGACVRRRFMKASACWLRRCTRSGGTSALTAVRDQSVRHAFSLLSKLQQRFVVRRLTEGQPFF